MSKAITPQQPNLPGFEQPRKCVIDGVEYASVLDCLAIYGDSAHPDRDWKRIKDKLRRQGYTVSQLVLYQFPGKDGRLKQATPVVTKEQIARIAQVTDYPEWEPIRQRMAEIFVAEQEKQAKPRLSGKQRRRMANSGIQTRDIVSWEKTDRLAAESYRRIVGQWVNRNGTISFLASVVMRVVTGKTPAQLRRELRIKESPRRYLSEAEKAEIALTEMGASYLHELRNSQGDEQLAIDVEDGHSLVNFEALRNLPAKRIDPPLPKPKQHPLLGSGE
jgi:hypothetical protein